MVGRQMDYRRMRIRLCRSVSTTTLLLGEGRDGHHNLLIHRDGQHDPLVCLAGHQFHQQCLHNPQNPLDLHNPRELQDLRDPQDPLTPQLRQHREEHIGIVFSKTQSQRVQVTRMMQAGRHKI